MRVTTFLLTMMVATIFSGSPVQAKTLDEALQSMAGKIAEYLKAHDRKEVSVESFQGPSGSTAGRAIGQSLKEKLTAQDISVQKLSDYQVRGDFSLVTDDGKSVATIVSELVDNNGRSMGDFRDRVQLEKVTSIEDLSRLFGLTVDLVDEQTGKEVEQIKNPATKVKTVDKLVSKKIEEANSSRSFVADNANTIIKAASSSDFGIQLLRCSKGGSVSSPLPIGKQGGFAFAPLEDGDTYQVIVINNSDHDVAAKVSIDGVNSFHFCKNDETREIGSWVVGAKSNGVIGGWYIDPEHLTEFLVTSDPNAIGLPDPLDLGVVTVQFFHCWSESEPTPAIELLAKATGRSQLRTGQGNVISQKGKTVSRNFGSELLASISVRYSNPDDLPEDVASK